MRTFKSIIAITLLLIATSSCSKKYDVTGVWTCSSNEKTDDNRLYMQMNTLTLTNDGEFTEEIIMQAGIVNITATGKGTYRISNDTLFATLSSYLIDGKGEKFEAEKDHIKRKILKADKDSLVYMQDNKITRMKRK